MPSNVTLFYSYAVADEALQQELEKHFVLLRQQHLLSDWHVRRIDAGADWVSTVDAHLNAAQIILLLVSSDYLASGYCTDIEMRRALERYQSGEALVIPILLRPVYIQGVPFAHLSCLPRNGKPVTKWRNRDEAFADIAEGLHALLLQLQNVPQATDASLLKQRAQAGSVKSAPSPGVWSVPYLRNPFFTGREELLERLHAKLVPGYGVALTQSTAIRGLGGIGKTQTALEYAFRFRAQYDAIFWIRAEERSILSADFAQIAHLLNISGKLPSIEAVKSWLATHERWLLVFDNVEDLQYVGDCIPTYHLGQVLITTRAQVTEPIAFALPLEKMRKDEAALFVLRRAKMLAPDVF